jgi:hypothetical protein
VSSWLGGDIAAFHYESTKTRRIAKNMNAKRLVITLFILASCNQQPGITDAEKAEVIAEVRQTLQNYYDDIRESGLNAEFKYLDNSAEFFWVPPGYSGPIFYDSVVSTIKEHAAKYKSVDNVFDTLHIVALSKRYATYTGRLRSTMTDTSGQANTFIMLETGILTKRSDGWKLLSGQTAIVNP